jgi:hypothetical protein
MLDDIMRFLSKIYNSETIRHAGKEVILHAVEDMGKRTYEWAANNWPDIAKAISNWFR